MAMVLIFYDSMTLITFNKIKKSSSMPRGLGTGGAGGARAPLELRFYRVKIFKIGKISFFVLLGPPLGKNRSQAPVFADHTLLVLHSIWIFIAFILCSPKHIPNNKRLMVGEILFFIFWSFEMFRRPKTNKFFGVSRSKRSIFSTRQSRFLPSSNRCWF